MSSGAALGAAAAIVGSTFVPALPQVWQPYVLSMFAFLGGLAVTLLVYRLGRRDGQTRVATMLLAGIALTALAGAIVGLFTYLADDTALRSLTFWNLGSLNGASYAGLWPLLLITLAVGGWLPRRATALNALLLGESEARHLGFDVERIKRELVVCTALGVGAAVATAGLIGFVGLVVPHLMRLLVGPDHRLLLPASALAGATLLLLADVAARLVIAPAELPIGIVTALLGAPFFLFLLLRGVFDAGWQRSDGKAWWHHGAGWGFSALAGGTGVGCARPERSGQEHLAGGSVRRAENRQRAGHAAWTSA